MCLRVRLPVPPGVRPPPPRRCHAPDGDLRSRAPPPPAPQGLRRAHRRGRRPRRIDGVHPLHRPRLPRDDVVDLDRAFFNLPHPCERREGDVHHWVRLRKDAESYAKLFWAPWARSWVTAPGFHADRGEDTCFRCRSRGQRIDHVIQRDAGTTCGLSGTGRAFSLGDGLAKFHRVPVDEDSRQLVETGSVGDAVVAFSFTNLILSRNGAANRERDPRNSAVATNRALLSPGVQFSRSI